MSSPARASVSRRGGRSASQMLLAALIVLAVVASAITIFFSSAAALRLGVVIALWAAVVGAFVATKLRRESEADKATARDLKLVYELQLDREISARREYELTVENDIRQQVEHEVRAQAADDIASLRLELASLRANLERLFDTDLGTQYRALPTDSMRVGEIGSSPYLSSLSDDARGPLTAEMEPVPPVDGVESAELAREARRAERGDEDPGDLFAETDEGASGGAEVDAEVVDAEAKADDSDSDSAAVDGADADRDGTAEGDADEGDPDEGDADDSGPDKRDADDGGPDEVGPDAVDADAVDADGAEPAEGSGGSHSQGRSVAELLAQLQASAGSAGTTAGRRRRN